MIDTETAQPTLYDVIQASIDERLLELCTSLPARVETYDAARQKVTVTLLVRQAHLDETGVRVVETLPIVTEVPVAFGSGGGYATTYPLAHGDVGVVWFSQASLDVWAQQGGIVDPLDDRRHHLADGIFYPGTRSFNAALATAPTDRARFGRDGDGPALEVTTSAVLVGGGEATTHQPTLKGTSHNAALATLLTALSVYAAAIQPIADPTGTVTTTFTTAISTLISSLASHLTTIAKVR